MMKLNRENNRMFDLCVCELYSMQNDDSMTFKDEGIDTGDFGCLEWLELCREAVRLLFTDMEERYDDEYEIKWADEIYDRAPEFLLTVVKAKDAERNNMHEFEYKVTANAFMTLRVMARSKGDADEIAQNIVYGRGFVQEHYTEFEIDSEAVILDGNECSIKK